MAKNRYFTEKHVRTQRLYEDIIIESLKIYGQDVYYLPRTIVNEDRIFGEDVPSKFSNAYKIEMYIENVEGFDGEGDLFTKFGVEIRDQATFIVARRRWDYTVGQVSNQINSERPLEGDLIYLPLSKSLFQIMHVEHEQPFYQISNLPTYKLRCELFEYNDEDFDTMVDEIDDVETIGYTISLYLRPNDDSANSTGAPNFAVGDNIEQLLSNGQYVHGEVANYNRTTQVLTLAHVGGDSASDGYTMFEPGIITVLRRPTGQVIDPNALESAYINRIIERVGEDIAGENEQNADFAATSNNINLDFLDFSETNPFGDPSQ